MTLISKKIHFPLKFCTVQCNIKNKWSIEISTVSVEHTQDVPFNAYPPREVPTAINGDFG